MLKLALVTNEKPQIICAHADHVSPLTPRTQSRYSGELEPSRPPFKPSRIRNLIGALISAVAA